MSVANHPEKQRLVDLHEGRLAESEIDMVADHVAACELCHRLMEEIERYESSLVARLRADDTTVERLPNAFQQRLVEAGRDDTKAPTVDFSAATVDGLVASNATSDGRQVAVTVDHSILSKRSAFATGDRFGNYEIINEIDRGGMGVVYRARQVSANRLVALKMILDSRLASPESVQRFRSEAEAAAGLDHPGIVSVFDVGECDGQNYYSMQLIEGGSLQDLQERGPLDRRRAVEIMSTVSRTVQFAHTRNIVHRDLKPANVLLGEAGAPLLTDFGLAKDIEKDAKITTDGQVMGTPHYMAPEQAAGRTAEVGPLSDVYSLGAILYFLVTNTRPFSKPDVYSVLHAVIHEMPRSPREIDATIEVDLATICMKCLEKDPAERYPSAAELADDLDRFLRGEPITARPISAWERTARWARRNTGAVWGAIVTAVLMMVAVVAAAIGLDRQVQTLERSMDQVSQQSLHETATWVASSAESELRQKFRQVREAAASPDVRRYLQELVRDEETYEAAKQRLHEQDVAGLADPNAVTYDPPPGLRPIQYWISADERWRDSQNVLSWWVCGPDGHQIARDPWKASVSRDFRFRSYFTGLDYDADERTVPEPVWQPSDGPRLSAVFLTRETNYWVLAVSAPVFQDAKFVGVIGIFLRLGSLLEHPPESEEQPNTRYAMLLDARPDGQIAKIIEHPYHRHANSMREEHLRQEVATIAMTREEWRAAVGDDPFGLPEFQAESEFGGKWRSSWAPVRVPDGRGTELVALVREREELVSLPSKRLRTNLRWLGLAVVGLLVLPPVIAFFILSRR